MTKKVSKKLLFLFFGLLLLIPALFLCGCFGNNDTKKTDDKPVQITIDMVNHVDALQYKNGQEVKFEQYQLNVLFNGRWFYENDDFSVAYENNINAGTATATITMNENHMWLKGSVSFNFVIEQAGNQIVTNVEELKAATTNPNFKGIEIGNLEEDFIIPETEEIVIPETKTFRLLSGSFRNIYNYGKLTINGSLLLGTSQTWNVLYNVGEIHTTGSVTNMGRIFNSGIFDCKQTMSNQKQIYTDTDINQTTTTAPLSFAEYVKRTQLDECEIVLTKTTMRFEKDKNTTTFSITGQSGTNLDVAFSNNDRPGTASITISALLFNTTLGGSITKTFEITKGKTNFETLEEFKELQETECYNEYTYTKNNLLIDENTEINSDETLTITGMLSVNENVLFKNNGTVNLNYNYVTLNGKIENNGTINSLYIYGGAGDVLNNQNAQMTVMLNNTFDGSFENNGTSTFYSTLSILGNLTNTGTLTTPSIKLFNGTLTNSGNLSIHNKTQQNDFGSANITNTGLISLHGKACYANQESHFENVQNGFEFLENGKIWCFAPLENLTDNVIVRKNLSSATLTLVDTAADFDAEHCTYVYNQKSHTPTLYVDGTNEYSTKSGPVFNGNVKNVGTVTVSLTIRDDDKYCDFYGTNSTTYEILATSAHITTETEFKDFLKQDQNWTGYVLENDLEVTLTTDLMVYAAQTFDTNGHNLKLLSNKTLYVDGTLIVKVVDGDENLTLDKCGLVLNSSASLEILQNGTLQNNGNVFVGNVGSRIFNFGEIVGSGTIFANTNSNIDSDENTIYLREFANTSENISLNSSSFVFNGLVQNPTVLASAKGSSLNVDEHFDVKFPNESKRGTYEVTISTASDFDHFFVGVKSILFEITPHIFEISSSSLLTQANISQTNFDHFKLTANVTMSENLSLNEDCIFDFGAYRITNLKGSSAPYKITAHENNEIWVSVSTYNDFQDFAYVATKIKLLSNLSRNGNGSYINFGTTSENMNIVGSNLYYLELDLNGHNIVDSFDVYNNQTEHEATLLITNSSDTTAFVLPFSTTTVNAAFSTANTKAKLHLNIFGKVVDNKNNITICGLTLKGNGADTSNVSVHAQYVNFDTLSNGVEYAFCNTTGAKNAEALFENCIFRAPEGIKLVDGTSDVEQKFVNCKIYATATYEQWKHGYGVWIQTSVTAGNTNTKYIKATFERCYIYANGDGLYCSYNKQQGVRCYITLSHSFIFQGTGHYGTNSSSYTSSDRGDVSMFHIN